MKIRYWLAGFLIALIVIGTILTPRLRESDKVAYGKLHLPTSHGNLTEVELASLLNGISVNPTQSPLLNPVDRQAFLSFLQQICALAELPDIQDVYLSNNATVWKVLSANFPETKQWLTDPSISPEGKVSIKKLAKQIKELNP